MTTFLEFLDIPYRLAGISVFVAKMPIFSEKRAISQTSKSDISLVIWAREFI